MARRDLIFKLTGHKELMSRLSGMGRKMRRSIAAKAIRAGQKIMVKAIRSAAPKATGGGAKAIGTKIKTYRNSQVTVGITGERIGSQRGVKSEGKQKYPGAHFHLIEYGTGERFHTGEKTARRIAAIYTARAQRGKFDSEKFLRASLEKAGSFGRQEAVGFSFRKNKAAQTLQFSQNIRAAQAQAKRALFRFNVLALRTKSILKDVRSGKSTGRVRPRPFFKRAFQSAVGAVQAAQLAVLRREIEAAARAA